MFIRTFILIAPDDGPKPWPWKSKNDSVIYISAQTFLPSHSLEKCLNDK